MKQGELLTDIARNNKTGMVCHGIEAAIITFFYCWQFFAGVRTLGYVIIVAVLALVPTIAEQVLYARDKETPAIKHLLACFAILYTFLLFTATNYLVFVFVIPMILVVSVYNDEKFSLKINIGTVVESLIVVIVGSMTGKFGYRDMNSGVIQIMIMMLIGIYSFYTARTLKENNRQKVITIEEAQNKTESVLNDVSQTAELMRSGMEMIHQRVEKLDASFKITKEAMQDVTSGTADTAGAVQNQLRQTEAIQEKVGIVSDATNHITENMQLTLEVLESGNRDVELLVRQVEQSVSEGADIAEKLITLDKYIVEMNTIVEVISSITSQTSLLALNASIEAARAGEAGRGFSVVATEISGMATQTKEATVNITELIGNVSKAINEVVGVIREMIEGINEEKVSTANTAESFSKIQSNTYGIKENVEHLAGNVVELQHANQEIADSIQTISAISEEVSAHANETLEAEEENASIIGEISEKMQELMEVTKE